MRSQGELRAQQTGTGLVVEAGRSRTPAPAACGEMGRGDQARPPWELGAGRRCGPGPAGTEWPPAQRRWGGAGGPGRGPETATGGKERVRDREPRKENMEGGRQETRARGMGLGGGAAGPRTGPETQEQGTESPESPTPSPLPHSQPSLPPPQAGCGFHDNLARQKGGLGTAEEIFHISRKGGGRMQEGRGWAR